MDKRSLIFIILLSICFFAIQEYFSPAKKTTPSSQITTPSKEQEQPAALSPKEFNKEERDLHIDKREDFYVLQNDTVQIVFSTLGGAISEINLPFRSKENTKSLVHPIGPDAILEKQDPINSLFPSRPYYVFHKGSKQFIKKGTLGGYYPLLRRAFLSKNYTVAKKIPPEFYATNLVSDDPNLEKSYYKVTHFDQYSITLVGKYKSSFIEKTYRLTKDGKVPYCIDLHLDISNNNDSLWLSSGVLEVELMPTHVYLLRYRYENNNKFSIEKLSLPKSAETFTTIPLDWLSSSNGFFGTIIDPLSASSYGVRSKFISGTVFPTRYALIDTKFQLYPAQKYPGYELFLGIGKNGKKDFRIFCGPSQTSLIKVIDKEFSNPLTGYTPDYKAAFDTKGFFSFITAPFAKLLFLLMSFFHKITFSWGLSIILLTILLRIMLYPLNTWSIKSNMRLQEVAPQIKALQARYKHDQKKQQAEMIKLYKEMKANPLTGCFPIIIQMPFLFGMFNLLRTSFELRGVGFIPGWINNLTAPDVLFSWSYPIFFFGTEFHLIPFLVALSMFLQQKLSSPLTQNTSTLTDQQKQQKMMMYIMPIVFIFITYNLASGLNIYWFSSTLLGIIQQMIMVKKRKAALAANSKK